MHVFLPTFCTTLCGSPSTFQLYKSGKTKDYIMLLINWNINSEANAYTQMQRHNFITWPGSVSQFSHCLTKMMYVSIPSEVHTSSTQQHFKVCKFYVKIHSPASDQHAEYNITKHISIGVIQHLFGHNYLLISVITMLSLWFYSK